MFKILKLKKKKREREEYNLGIKKPLYDGFLILKKEKMGTLKFSKFCCCFILFFWSRLKVIYQQKGKGG